MFKVQTEGQCDWRLVKGIRVEGDEIRDVGLRVWVFFQLQQEAIEEF